MSATLATRERGVEDTTVGAHLVELGGRRVASGRDFDPEIVEQLALLPELCLALGKRVGCRFIWLSATVDPRFYARYLDSAAVVESSAFDPAKAADVQVIHKAPYHFLDDRFMQRVVKEQRGVGVFLPTRAAVEEAALAPLRREGLEDTFQGRFGYGIGIAIALAASRASLHGTTAVIIEAPLAIASPPAALISATTFSLAAELPPVPSSEASFTKIPSTVD